MPVEYRKSVPPVRPRRRIRIEIRPKSMIIAALVIFCAWLFIKLLPVVLVLVVALMIVGTFSPAVAWLEARKIRRGGGIAIVFGSLSLAFLAMMVLTIPALIEQVKSLVEQEPALRRSVAEFLMGSPLTASLGEALTNLKYDALIKDAGEHVLAYSKSLVEVVAYSAGAFFLALYIMIDRDRLRGAAFAVIPRAEHIRFSRILINLETIVGGYIRGQVVTCLMMGGFMFILLTACGVPNALALSVFGGIADVLPFIGIFLTMGPAVLAALVKGPVIVAIVFVAMLAYEEFESRVLVPMVYGRALRLPSSVVLFALIAGGTLAGIVGALLALPVAAAILMLIDEMRVELPGEETSAEGDQIMAADKESEQEYARRTEGMPAEQAAAVALNMSNIRKKEESEAQDKQAGQGL